MGKVVCGRGLRSLGKREARGHSGCSLGQGIGAAPSRRAAVGGGRKGAFCGKGSKCCRRATAPGRAAWNSSPSLVPFTLPTKEYGHSNRLHQSISKLLCPLKCLMQAADVREARLMAELRELDMAASDRDELLAQVAALRDKLSDQRDERGQVEHYRQVSGAWQTPGEVIHEPNQTLSCWMDIYMSCRFRNTYRVCFISGSVADLQFEIQQCIHLQEGRARLCAASIEILISDLHRW